MSSLKDTVTPFENQKAQYEKLRKRKRALLVDKAGSGKTLTTLMSFCNLFDRQLVQNLLVFSPRSAFDKNVWRNETHKWTHLRSISFPDLVAMYERNPTKLEGILKHYQVIYGKNTHLTGNPAMVSKILATTRCVVAVDEVHKFKNPKLKTTQTAKIELSRSYVFWAITATPLSRDLSDFYNIVDFIKPFALGSFNAFKSTHCYVGKQVIGYDQIRKKRREVEVVLGCRDWDYLMAVLDYLIIQGESSMEVEFVWERYEMSKYESSLYDKIASGLTLDVGGDDSAWFSKVLSEDIVIPNLTDRVMKSVDKHSSRFIYLQTVANGMMSETGEFTRTDGVKTKLLLDRLKELTDKGESVLVYCSYLSTVALLKKIIPTVGIKAKVLESTGDHVLTDRDFNESHVKTCPHIVLCTKASSESASYYFLKTVFIFEIPTVPDTFAQFVGRITRKNSMYPDELRCHIFISDNIDMYKMLSVSAKAYQMERISNKENNIPEDYKVQVLDIQYWNDAKKRYLWRKN